MKYRHTYSAGYADIWFNPNDGTDSHVIAKVIDPILADHITMALNYLAHKKRFHEKRRKLAEALLKATYWATGDKIIRRKNGDTE